MDFHQDLTVLVGENNGGKSNIIDAIRLLTQPVSGRRDRWSDEDDIRLGTGDSFKIIGNFHDLCPTQKGMLISAVPDPSKNEALVGLTFEKAGLRGRNTVWVGKFESVPEPRSLELIRHVYLPPLRDAQRELGSSSQTRIAALLRQFLGNDKTKEQDFITSLQRTSNHDILTQVNNSIKGVLEDLTGGVRQQDANLGFSAAENLQDIGRDLRFRLADSGINLEDLSASGLGYSNLLFMTTVMVELEKAREADLTLLLVEEPEAHLHPQLQMLVLDFLRDKAQESYARKVDAGHPAGRIQVIVTTHSPNLTAWVEPEHLVSIRSLKDTNTPKKQSHCIALRKLSLSDKELAKVSRYLDVMRSALLFGGRVLLLEGIAEAILIPVIAQQIVLKDDKKKWKKFQGTTLVPIGGVDFEPYVKILLSKQYGTCVADRVIVVTDRDLHLKGNRKEDLESLVKTLGTQAHLKVIVNYDTLESDIFLSANTDILKQTFLDVHPNSSQKWSDEIEKRSEAERPKAFKNFFSSTRKGDFAQHLAYKISKGEKFEVPGYLREAILEVVND